MAPHVRPFLAVGPTTLTNGKGKRVECNGLFATRPLKRGRLLGFYNGRFTDRYPDGDSILRKYVFNLSDDETMIVPRSRVDERTGKEFVDPTEYPLAMCNEPPPDEPPNVQTYELTRAGKYVTREGLSPKTPVVALLFFACSDVAAGDELFVSYGNEFDRDYPVSLAQPPPRLRVREQETVEDLVRTHGECCKHVDEECFTTYEED